MIPQRNYGDCSIDRESIAPKMISATGYLHSTRTSGITSDGSRRPQLLRKPKGTTTVSLKHSSAGGVDIRLAEIEASITQLRSRYPELTKFEPERSAQEYAGLMERSKQAHVDGQDRYRRLKDAIDRSSAGLKHPAEIDEEIAIQRGGLRHLEWYRDALKLASDELTEAKHEYQRQFAPKLERLMSDGLARVSNGRYTAATVDPSTLDVSLKAPERQELVNVANPIPARADLIYLMLRIAIARLLSRSTEVLPLMMDDPLVQFDRGRQERALEFLSQLAADTQVFLFSKDEWTSEWFRNNLGGSPLHALHSLR